MSLLDSLLLDPAAFHVWVAIRPPGSGAGSGTLTDPYDGSTRLATPVAVTSLVNNGGDTQEAIAAAAGHTYANGDVVTITGVTGSAATTWNGSFAIHGVVADVPFKYYLLSTPSAAAGAGSITAAKVLSYWFDEIMSG